MLISLFQPVESAISVAQTGVCERCSTPLLRADFTRLTGETSTQNGDLLEHDWNINPKAGIRQHPFLRGRSFAMLSALTITQTATLKSDRPALLFSLAPRLPGAPRRTGRLASE